MINDVESSPTDRRPADIERFGSALERALAERRIDNLLPSLRRIDGTDSAGLVHCVVDEAGRFVDVSIPSDFQRGMDAGHLGLAVLEALETARFKAALVPAMLRRFGLTYEPWPRPVWLPSEQAYSPPGTPGFLDGVEERLQESRRLLEEATERMRRRAEELSEQTTSSPHGIFRATRVDGRVVRLVADDYAVRSADADLLTAEVRALLATGGTR